MLLDFLDGKGGSEKYLRTIKILRDGKCMESQGLVN